MYTFVSVKNTVSFIFKNQIAPCHM